MLRRIFIMKELKALTCYKMSELHEYSTVPKTPLFINGRFVESKTNDWIPVHNPVIFIIFIY